MITAVHTLVYAEDADAARDFFRDVLEWPHVDAGDGWLIFKTGPSELGVHPADVPRHQVSLMCDDLDATMESLESKGARFSRGPRDDGWGVTAMLEIPGAGEMMLYQPRHAEAHSL